MMRINMHYIFGQCCKLYVNTCSFVKGKGTFLYGVAYSPWDCSKRFTLHLLAHLFVLTSSRLLWKHSATLQLLREDRSFTNLPLSIARYSFMQLSELWGERNFQSFETAAREFELGFSRLGARRSKRYVTAPSVIAMYVYFIVLYVHCRRVKSTRFVICKTTTALTQHFAFIYSL